MTEVRQNRDSFASGKQNPLKQKKAVPSCDNCPQSRLEISANRKTQKHNDSLRGELRDMSMELDVTLEKLKGKRIEFKPQVNTEQKIELLQRELENVKKQFEIQKKNLQAAETKQQGDYNVDKVAQLTSFLKQRQQDMQELKLENRKLVKLQRESEQKLNKRTDLDVNSLRDEIINIKNLIREAEKVYHINEKNYKMQAEYIGKLELKHREMCKHLNIEFSVQMPRAEDFIKAEKGAANRGNQQQQQTTGTQPKTTPKASKKSRAKTSLRADSTDDEEAEHVPEEILTYENFHALQQKINILEKHRTVMEKQQKLDLENIAVQIRDSENEKKQLDEKLSQKIKSLEEAVIKIKELKVLAAKAYKDSAQSQERGKSAMELHTLLENAKNSTPQKNQNEKKNNLVSAINDTDEKKKK